MLGFGFAESRVFRKFATTSRCGANGHLTFGVTCAFA